MLSKGLCAALILTTLFSRTIGEDISIGDDKGSDIGDEPTRTFPDINPRGNSDTRCSPGTYSSKGTTPCLDCSPGFYSKESGVTSCIPARAGYYIPTAKATAESTCKAGTYSSTTGCTLCNSCPPGSMCPNNALANPQRCSPGRYSMGGLTDCTKCGAGTFNNIQGATGCCPCAAGWFNDQLGNTNCQACSNQYPYSDPGTGDRNKCSAKSGSWAISSSSTQGSDGACPASSPFASVSAKPKRHVMHAPLCRRTGQKACPVFGFNWRGGKHHAYTSFECVDIENDLESCGGCVQHSNDGEFSADGGRDCSAIPNISSVRCHKSQCLIDSCQAGFIQSADGIRCVPNL